MIPYRPQKIFIEKNALDFPHTKIILKNLPDVPVEILEDQKRPELSPQGAVLTADPIGASKRSLLLKCDKGRSFKPFPEAEQYLSCDYFTLHVAEGCDLECSYCILQAYLNNPLLTVHVNLEEMLLNLEKTLRQNPEKFFRIGTGQLADSLSLDPITEFSKTLVPFFAKQPNAILELKTKSNFVDHLLNLPHQNHTIISWSMNSEKIQKQEEHRCATLKERLAAAQKVIRAGYSVAFHFDPLIDYPGWEAEYEKVIEDLFSQISEEKIRWISLGCLRFMPQLKEVMQNRFPKSSLPLAEWVTGMDGKMRYFKPRRIQIYRRMVKKIRQWAPHVTLYLSMESAEVWHQVFGIAHNKETVCAMLDRAGQKFAGSAV